MTIVRLDLFPLPLPLLPGPVLLSACFALLYQSAGIIIPVVNRETVVGLVEVASRHESLDEPPRFSLPQSSVSNFLGIVSAKVSILRKVEGPVPDSVKVPYRGWN